MAEFESDAGEKMAAAYVVSITGIERTKAELAKVSSVIKQLREAQYMTNSRGEGVPMTTVAATKSGREDVLVARIDGLEGRVQSGTEKAMAAAMANGRKWQGEALRAAVTDTGLSGKPKGRKGTGREVTGKLIGAIKTNVETSKTASATQVVGWHGWPDQGREKYHWAQEKGTEHIEAADSLGMVILVVREELKRELGKLKK